MRVSKADGSQTEPAKVHMAKAAMGKAGMLVNDLCQEMGISRQTLYRYVSPTWALRPDGKKLLKKR